MSGNCRPLSLQRFVLAWTGLTVLALLPQTVSGQAKVPQTPLIVEVAIGAGKNNAAAREIDLRPNTPTEFAVALKNFAGEILGDVKLKLVQVVDGKEHVIAETMVEKLAPTGDKEAGQLVQLFDKIKGGPDKIELTGIPPFKLQVHVQAKNLLPIKRDLNLFIREPRDYVSAPANFDPVKSKLSVDVESKAVTAFVGPHLLPAQMIFGPDVTASKNGFFKRTLTPLKPKVTLVAEDLAFERKLTEGDVYLKVDGYERAFVYPVKVNSNGAVDPLPPGDIRVRIGVPRYAKPSPTFDVPLEIDGPLTGDFKVRVSLDRTGNNGEQPGPDMQELEGLRQQKIILGVTPDRKLICQTEIKDWRVQFDTNDILGRDIWYRVSVVTKGDTGKYDKKTALTVAPESRPLLARTETDDREKDIKSVYAKVNQDISAPEGIKLELPKDKEWAVGAPVELRAVIRERKENQAPIGKVVVFRGKAPKDDKMEIKDDDILFIDEAPDPKQKEWKFTLPPQTKAEALTLSVQFTTRTGVKAALTDSITFKAGGPVKKLYTVKGDVLRGELKQAGVEVSLMDAKKNVKATGKSNAEGAFVFENVEPGSYIVSAKQMNFQKLYGETVPFNVPDKEKKEQSISVWLLQK
jgi:hypothetical protein